MDVSKPPDDALKSPSGMPYKVLAQGTGDKPGQNDTVLVNYTGWRTTGEMFYSTERRGTPQPMSMVQLSQGWAEALIDMQVGEKRIYWMSPEMASRGKANPDQGDFVFQIEVSGIEPAPATPEHLKEPPPDAKKTKSGLAYKVLQPGTGTEKARLWDQVTVHYTAWSEDGKMVDSTAIQKRPRPMQLFRESPGWSEAIQMMVKGQKNRVWIPEKLLTKRPGSPPGGLVMEFEVVDIKQMNQPPPVPKDVAKPARGAKKTAGGVLIKTLKKGTGTEKPTADKTVKVHYTGWTTDGNMFDSSVVRSQPAQFPLRGVIPGWTEGLQEMVVGETARLWIPEAMAYEGKPGRPQGMLVFDVELLEIMDAPQHQMPTPGGHGGGAGGGHGGGGGDGHGHGGGGH
jgi:FKBP-type peptidyl-prolyl cis-trans isomerase